MKCLLFLLRTTKKWTVSRIIIKCFLSNILAVLCRWIGDDFRLRKAFPLPLDSEFLVVTILAGVPFPIASAALPSPPSSIIYVAIARICPEIHTRQSFNFFAPAQAFRSCWRAWVLSVRTARVSPLLLTPLSLSQHHADPPVPLSLAGQQGSWGCRLLFGTAEADMGQEVSNGIGGLGLIDFSSHILLRPNHHRLRVKYVCP